MRVLLTILAICLPTAAMALSCIPPNAGRELNVWLEKGHKVTVVSGVLTPVGRAPRRIGKQDVTHPYRLVGTELTRARGDRPFAQDILFTSNCVIEWCGPLPSEPQEGLFLLRKRNGAQLELVTGPCRAGMYQTNRLYLDALRRCLAKGQCGEKELKMLSFSRG